MGDVPEIREPVTGQRATRQEQRQPADDLVQLEVAFDMLGKHHFGGAWGRDMAHRVRLGQAMRNKSEADDMAGQALNALTQCVQNGWLPLFYFIGERPVRRIEYFRNPSGAALHALYPRPHDDDETGYVELDGGDICPCMVDVRGFGPLLRAKFGNPSGRRGPARDFAEFDEALDAFYVVNPPQVRGKQVLRALEFKGRRPERTTAYQRIDEAAERAIKRLSWHNTPDKTSDG